MVSIQPQVPVLFDEVLEFLASTPTPQQIIEFHPSDELDTRISHLLEMNRQGTLSTDKAIELEEFSRLEHFMRMLKIKAQQKLIVL